MKCKYCGTENEGDAKFCVGCGKNLVQDFSAATKKDEIMAQGKVNLQKEAGMGNDIPSSMVRATASSSAGGNSALTQRIVVGVAAFIVVLGIAYLIQWAADQANNRSTDRSSYYGSQEADDESDADSYDSDSYDSNSYDSSSYDSNSYSSGSVNDQSGTDSFSDNSNGYNTYSYGADDDWDYTEEDEEEDDSDYADEESDDRSEYIFPNSDTEKLTKADLRGMTSEELRLGRNEIYARHGRMFNDEELQEYFNEKSWYFGSIEPSEFVDSQELNKIERRNAKFILKYEKSH